MDKPQKYSQSQDTPETGVIEQNEWKTDEIDEFEETHNGKHYLFDDINRPFDRMDIHKMLTDPRPESTVARELIEKDAMHPGTLRFDLLDPRVEHVLSEMNVNFEDQNDIYNCLMALTNDAAAQNLKDSFDVFQDPKYNLELIVTVVRQFLQFASHEVEDALNDEIDDTSNVIFSTNKKKYLQTIKRKSNFENYEKQSYV